MQTSVFHETLDQKQILYLESMSLKWFPWLKMSINSQNSKPETLNHKWYHIFSSEQSSLWLTVSSASTREEAETVAVDFGQSLNLFSSGNQSKAAHAESWHQCRPEHIPCIPSVLSSNFQMLIHFPVLSPIWHGKRSRTSNLQLKKSQSLSLFLPFSNKKKVRGRKDILTCFFWFCLLIIYKKKKKGWNHVIWNSYDN